MQDDRPISVLILYTHPLLGEGLTQLLGSEERLVVTAVASEDPDAVERALAASPQVVIFERGDPDRAVRIFESVPDALIIDVGIGAGPTFTYRREEIPAWPDAILETIRRTPSPRDSSAVPVPATPAKLPVGS